MKPHAFLLAAVLIALPGVALGQGAQSATGVPAGVGDVDFGARITGGLGDVGRYQTFGDPTSGPTLNRLRYERNRDTWVFTARFDNAGYRDQRYQASFDKFGKVKASFDWNQIPTWYSGVSQSPFREELSGVFRLDDTIRQAVENRTGTL